MRVTVTDHGVPQRSSTANIRVQVGRDEGDLSFTASQYSAQISENRNIGNTVLTVRAAPGDDVRYFITGNGNGPEYFSIEEDSGQIKVSKAITEDRVLQTTYVVSLGTIFLFFFVDFSHVKINLLKKISYYVIGDFIMLLVFILVIFIVTALTFLI